MAAIAMLLVVIALSLLITRSAAVLLELTGMSRDSARFQARAAYCGVGYSSRESEGIMEHPLRRRIISTLMLLGNAGTATVIATLILSFRNDEVADPAASRYRLLYRLLIVTAGLFGLYLFALSKWLDEKMSQFIQWALKKYSRLDLNDYLALLHLRQGYSVLEVKVHEGEWLNGSDLATLKLAREGVLVLGIRKPDGTYIGVPKGTSKVEAGDVLTLYGKLDRLEEINHRQVGLSGLFAHEVAVSERQREAEEVITHGQLVPPAQLVTPAQQATDRLES